MAQHPMMLFSGNSNRSLSESMATILNIPVGKACVSTFSDGEIMIEILENVRGRDVFILQSTCAPANDHLMELVLLADALRRASAARITAVMPYFGYARQDRRVRSARVPISAKVVADMMNKVGIDRVLTVDLHADQIQGFFYIPVDNVYATYIMIDDIRSKQYDNTIVVSPDVGGVVRARAVAKRLGCDLAIIDKRRSKPNEAQVMNIIGDVSKRSCILVDDMIDTAGTLCQAASVLKQNGANAVVAYATHPVLSGAAVANIETSALDEVVVTDTIPLSNMALQSSKIRQLSIADMLSQAVKRVNEAESVSSMFAESE